MEHLLKIIAPEKTLKMEHLLLSGNNENGPFAYQAI